MYSFASRFKLMSVRNAVVAAVSLALVVFAGFYYFTAGESGNDDVQEYSPDLAEKTPIVKERVMSAVSCEGLRGEVLDGVKYGALLSQAKLVKDNSTVLEGSNGMQYVSYPLLVNIEGDDSGSKLTVVLANAVYTSGLETELKVFVRPAVYARTPHGIVRYDAKGAMVRTPQTYWKQTSRRKYTGARQDIAERINKHIAQQ